MAIAPSLTLTVDPENQLATVTNTTTWDVGVGESRAENGLFLFVYSALSSGYVAQYISGSPSIVESWIYTITDAVDSRIYMIIAKKWGVSVVDYLLDDIVYDSIDNNLYICIVSLASGATSPSSDAVRWRLLNTSVTNDIHQVVVPTNFIAEDLGQLLLQASDESLKEEYAEYEKNLANTMAVCGCNENCTIEIYEKIRLYYEAITDRYTKGERLLAQEMYEYILELKKQL